MIEKMIIHSKKETLLPYISEIKLPKQIKFKKGVNLLVGDNGSGKSSIIEILRRYMLVPSTKYQSEDEYWANLPFHYNQSLEKDDNKIIDVDDTNKAVEILNKIEVFADYRLTSFNLRNIKDMNETQTLADFTSFKEMYNGKNSSSGESVLYGIQQLFDIMFNPNTKSKYPRCSKEREYYNQKHQVNGRSVTLFFDEPDRNLSIDKISQLFGILSDKREDIQIIGAIHNPLLILKLKKEANVNFIELTKGYLQSIEEFAQFLKE